MNLVYSGFDGLDLAIKATAPLELVTVLEEGKAHAIETQTETQTIYKGYPIRIAGHGGKGGYAFQFDTGSLGAIWVVKKPKASDPWGVRVSVRSRSLAIFGFEQIRSQIEKLCSDFGLLYPPDGISISRVDYAIDILTPDFVLDPDHFVMHARSRRKTHADIEDMQTDGVSGRYTSVTVGKMPGRQVIIYDKRAEVLKHGKREWPIIWAEELKRLNFPSLDLADPKSSRVWRIELRLGKNGLRSKYDIRGWSALYKYLTEELIRLQTDVTLCTPTTDSNRSRWPAHPIWDLAGARLKKPIFNEKQRVEPETVKQADLQAKQEQFFGAVAAHAVTLGFLEGYALQDFSDFVHALPGRIEHFIENHSRDLERRWGDAEVRYGDLRR